MSQLKNKDYLAFAPYFRTETGPIDINLDSLKDVPGIYMIKNKTTKKIYIGKSLNLRSRFKNYLDIKRLENNKSSRIHKALLKYGFECFSISIIQIVDDTKYLNSRENFYIKVFKPQYNIARSTFNRDNSYEDGSYSKKKPITIPTKVTNLLHKCLDSLNLNWHIYLFKYHKKKASALLFVFHPIPWFL